MSTFPAHQLDMAHRRNALDVAMIETSARVEHAGRARRQVRCDHGS